MTSNSASSEGSILFVGLSCLDIVNFVDEYPEEDSDQRCGQKWLLGGNAANNAKICNQIKPQSCLLATVLCEDHVYPAVVAQMKKFGINQTACVTIKGVSTGVSCCVVSRKTGSRTITHFPGSQRELSYDEFVCAVSLHMGSVSWVHFEGRNFEGVPKMINWLTRYHPTVKISVELEKAKHEMESLLVPGIDVVFLGKTFAKSRGYADMNSAVKGISDKYRLISPNKEFSVICAWDILGAAGLSSDSEEIVSSESFNFGQVVDTLGAGDTFIAGCVYALNSCCQLKTAVQEGCMLAGYKVCTEGFRLDCGHVRKVFPNV